MQALAVAVIHWTLRQFAGLACVYHGQHQALAEADLGHLSFCKDFLGILEV